MKVLFINAHGKAKINQDLFSLSNGQTTTFLCELGELLSLEQVNGFLDYLVKHSDLQAAITNTPGIKKDTSLLPKEFLESIYQLKSDTETIKSGFTLKLAKQQLESFEKFVVNLFSPHNEIERISQDLLLTDDHNQHGLAAKVVQNLTTNHNFFELEVAVYEYDYSTDTKKGLRHPGQLLIVFDFNKLKTTGSVDFIYLTPSLHIKPSLLSEYIEKLQHAYIYYDKTKNQPLEAFIDLTGDNGYLNNLQQSSDLMLYDFGENHKDIVIGACREIDTFHF